MSYTADLSLLEFVRLNLARKYGNQRKAAEAIGISPSMLAQVLCGAKAPTPKILDEVGLERRVVYVRKGEPGCAGAPLAEAAGPDIQDQSATPGIAGD